MRILGIILWALLLGACTTTQQENSDETDEVEVLPEETENLQSLEKAKLYRFYIPKEYLLGVRTATLDTSLHTNELNLNNQFYAKLYSTEDSASMLAITKRIDIKNCAQYESHLLVQNENGQIDDVFTDFYPDLSLYSFYTFEDEETGQLEGDEQTIFAGYHLHLDTPDSLGVQFMFCNKLDSANTFELNQTGEILYKSIQELN